MMTGGRISTKSLAQLCRSLSTMLHGGIAIQRAFAFAADKTRDPRARRALQEISESIARGEDISTSMRQQGRRFPGLMIDMVNVGEQTGSLPEVLQSLAVHFERTIRLRRTFLRSIAWPVFQFIAATLVIALLIWVLGMIAGLGPSSTGFDPLGFGLSGETGALIWLGSIYGTALGLFILYKVAARSVSGRRFLDPFLLHIPAIGHCIRSFAIARFSWAFALTQQAGMSIQPSLDASLRATGNGAFAGAAPRVWAQLKGGDTLSDALGSAKLFPADFIHMVEVGETSGTVPETLERLSPQFEEQAERSLTALTAVFGWFIWSLVAVFIIFLIFRIALWYVGMINDATNEALGF